MTKLAPWYWTPARSWTDTLSPDLFRDLFAKPQRAKAAPSFTPRVDVVETPEAYLLKLELPGLNPEDVEITLKEKSLTIKGEKASGERSEGETWHVVERRSGSFTRTFTFPEAVDSDSVSATSEHGLLTIEVKKAPETQPKRITISS